MYGTTVTRIVDPHVSLPEFIYNDFELYSAVLLINCYDEIRYYRNKHDANMIVMEINMLWEFRQEVLDKRYPKFKRNGDLMSTHDDFERMSMKDELRTFKKMPFESFRQIVDSYLNYSYGEYDFFDFNTNTRELTITLFDDASSFFYICSEFEKHVQNQNQDKQAHSRRFSLLDVIDVHDDDDGHDDDDNALNDDDAFAYAIYTAWQRQK